MTNFIVYTRVMCWCQCSEMLWGMQAGDVVKIHIQGMHTEFQCINLWGSVCSEYIVSLHKNTTDDICSFTLLGCVSVYLFQSVSASLQPFYCHNMLQSNPVAPRAIATESHLDTLLPFIIVITLWPPVSVLQKATAVTMHSTSPFLS